MTRRGAASVALGLALVVQGCAGLIAGKDSAEAPPAAPAGSTAPVGGEVLVEKGRPGLVIAAPHPEYRELKTDKPVADLWNILGEGVLI